MTLEEAIKDLEYGTKQLEMELESGLWIKGSESELRCKEGIALNKQHIEWLKELKEAKRLLKVALEDFAVYGALKDLSAEQRVQNPDWRRFNRVFDVLDHQWRYADEALKLIENS